MSDDGKVTARFAGPGQWYAQAKRLQAEHQARHAHDAHAPADAEAPVEKVDDTEQDDTE